MKKNILFIDFNWVISYKNFWFSLEKLDIDVYSFINDFLFVKNLTLVNDWMLWKYTSEEICRIIVKNANINIVYEYIYNYLVNDCINIDLSKKILNKLLIMKKYFYIILVTDNMDCFSRFTVKYNKRYFKIFDEIFNSYNTGYFKNQTYEKFIIKYDSKINLSYLIDDSINNCSFFESIWWNSLNLTWEKNIITWLNQILKNLW